MTSNLRLTAAAAALIAFATAAAASAADKPADKPAEKTDEAGIAAVPVLIGDAVAEYDAGRYEEARALFRLAHEKTPTARTLRGIGMASFEMRDYVEATRALAASLRDQRRPLTPDQRKHAQALLSRAETFVGHFSIKLSPASISVFIDGRPAMFEADGSLLLPLGRHEISLRCSSCSPNEKQLPIDVVGGERKPLELALAVGPVAPPPPPMPTDSAGGTGPGNVPTLVGGGSDVADGRSNRHLWLAGVAGVAVVAAGGSALWWRQQQQELDSCRSMEAAGSANCTNEDSLATKRGLAIGTTIGLGVTAIATGVMAAIFWSRNDQAAPTSTSNVACFGGRSSVGCAFRF